MKTKPHKFHAKEWVRASQSCSIQVGPDEYTFTSRSQPVKGDHPAVKSNPGLFEPVDPDYEPPASPAA
jgi:hypothetical protein